MPGSTQPRRPSRRRVSFADELVSAVHVVPRGGREMEPGFLARQTRVSGLKLHGLRASRARVNSEYGNGNAAGGSRGTYTDDMAERNLWHFRKYGKPWYRASSAAAAGGATQFVPRVARNAKHANRLPDMLEFLLAQHLAPGGQGRGRRR